MIEAQVLEHDEDPSFGHYLQEWLAHARGRVRATTYAGYEYLIRVHAVPALGEVPLSELSPLHFQRLYSSLLVPERHLSAGTVLNLHLVLTQALGQAVRWGICASNPVRGAQPPRPVRPEPVVVTPALARRIVQALPGSVIELPGMIAISTGMRRGEILGLRWADLHPDLALAQVRRTLHTTGRGLAFSEPKTRRSRRSVALPEILRPFLERSRSEQTLRRSTARSWADLDLVIDRGDGGPLNPNTMSSRWRLFLKHSGLPHVRFHDLRHAHATLMLLQGVHPKVVSERLGHASVGITLDLYSHVLPSMQQDAVRAFDELFA
ncbi:MAG: site-specific integrase [Chloroflexota bacterium]|nr:site-specific integrase [Chloroflexota bacterium]